jgi:hypothetical protein
VVVNYDEYERLEETLDILSDPVSTRQIAQSKGFYAKGRPGESFEAASDLSLRANAGSNNGRLSPDYTNPRCASLRLRNLG